jgi:hypothetical protein
VNGDPRYDAAWTTAKEVTPRRPPFTDHELGHLRIRYQPGHASPHTSPQDITVIWTLLDMLEQQRGWTLPPRSET